MVADPPALEEAERAIEPHNRLGDVGVAEHGDHL